MLELVSINFKIVLSCEYSSLRGVKILTNINYARNLKFNNFDFRRLFFLVPARITTRTKTN